MLLLLLCCYYFESEKTKNIYMRKTKTVKGREERRETFWLLVLLFSLGSILFFTQKEESFLINLTRTTAATARTTATTTPPPQQQQQPRQRLQQWKQQPAAAAAEQAVFRLEGYFTGFIYDVYHFTGTVWYRAQTHWWSRNREPTCFTKVYLWRLRLSHLWQSRWNIFQKRCITRRTTGSPPYEILEKLPRPESDFRWITWMPYGSCITVGVFITFLRNQELHQLLHIN